MKHYGIELEFFVRDLDGKLVPAYKATSNLDGNPILGEIRTDVFSDPVDLLFDLRRRAFIETAALKKKNFVPYFYESMDVPDEIFRELRKNREVLAYKTYDALEELSIYGVNKGGKILPQNLIKASCQLNISDNTKRHYITGTKQNPKDEYFEYSQPFDYVSLIGGLDIMFEEDIKRADRTPGVYAIKDGQKGLRIEYRSLPNNVNVEKLLMSLI